MATPRKVAENAAPISAMRDDRDAPEPSATNDGGGDAPAADAGPIGFARRFVMDVWTHAADGDALAKIRGLSMVVDERESGNVTAAFAMNAFLIAMGHFEAAELRRQEAGGVNPRYANQSILNAAAKAKLFGAADPDKAQQRRTSRRAREVESAVDGATSIVIDLCADLLRCLGRFAAGDQGAPQERLEIAARWNDWAADVDPQADVLHRLCAQCGQPLVWIARENKPGGRRGPPVAHPWCKGARDQALRRRRANGSADRRAARPK